MLLKVLGICAGLLGLALTVFAVMAWRELNSAATSELPPSPDSMPLLEIVGPELFDTRDPGVKPAKPADLAQAALKRIYIIGGGSFILLVVGILMLVLPHGPRTDQRSS
ncbi:hypothetical protein Pla100_15600 [Neorhodopirellula pilleata]|uniref:Uncharacterized protein n=1 Tax=Neorhodopirellula pilleata TaxID=2714738 RepID=A0A5C6AUH9_9BACT|nr:hypothetical protein Pla100_15600 [Neorhodopirellula pilleata]